MTRIDPATGHELLPANYADTLTMVAQRFVNEQRWDLVYALNSALLDEASDAFDRMYGTDRSAKCSDGMQRFHRSRRRDALDLANRMDWAVQAADRALGHAD